jgi:hypothetical protein
MAKAVGGKNRKYGRNSNWCTAYKNRNQREINKAKKLLKHFKRYGFASASAVHSYNGLPMNVKPPEMREVSLQPSKKKQKEREAKASQREE